MNIEKELEKLRKEYIHQEIPEYLRDQGAQNLNSRLNQNQIFHFKYQPRPRLAFALFSFALIAAVLVFAQNSKPSTPLYPVKILSDRIVAKITGDNQALIEKRAQEVIETSNNGTSFDEAKKQYQKTIDEAKNKANRESSQKKEDLARNLEEQEKKFQDAQKGSQTSQDRLEQVVEQTRQTRGEVKGERDNQNQQNPNEEENKNDKVNNGNKEHSNQGNSGD